jgi:hypothetical protein
MQDVNETGEPNRIDGAPRGSLSRSHDFKHGPPPESLECFDRRIFLAAQRSVQSLPDITLNEPRKGFKSLRDDATHPTNFGLPLFKYMDT